MLCIEQVVKVVIPSHSGIDPYFATNNKRTFPNKNLSNDNALIQFALDAKKVLAVMDGPIFVRIDICVTQFVNCNRV